MASSAMEEETEISQELLPCHICGRTFLPSPLKKHLKVCERNATRKRKIFDSLKQRVEGTDLAPFHQPTFLKKNTENQPQITQPVSAPVNGNNTQRSQSKWKEKHEELVQAIRAAKGEKVMGPRRSISAVGTMGTTERCPYCERQFGPKAYDRHVDWCKEHKNRVMKSPANVIQAKERLEARTKYRVPPLNKSKRSITREKYSTSLSRTDSVVSVRSAGSVERNGHERIVLERSPSVRRSRQTAMVATHHSVSEPVIKTKSTIEKTKSPHIKQRPSAPKVNSPHINESVEGMVVSKVNISFNEPTKLTTWKNINETNQANKLIINSNEVSLAVNTENSIVQMTDNGQLSISPLISQHPTKTDNEVFDNNELSVFDDKESIISNEYLEDENAKPSNCNDILTIKEPSNNNNYDMDSLYNDPETNNRFTLNKAYSNLELNSNNTDISISDIQMQPCKTSHIGDFNSKDEQKMDKDSLESMNSGVIWEQAEKDFLHSLKFKSNTSEMFSAELKTKYTSTPLQETFDTGSFTMRCEKLNFKDYLVIDETISFPILNVNDRTEVDIHDKTANIEDISECFTDLCPKEIVQLPLQENTEQYEHVIEDIPLPDISQKQFEDDEKFQTQLAEETCNLENNVVLNEKSPTITNNVDKSDYIDGRRQCNIEDLDRFLGSQPEERQLEIEIIATEICPNEKQTGPCLNLYQTHSKEIIIEGQSCLDTLNQLLSRNEVRSVNIIIVNEDICNEQKELEVSNKPIIIEYDETNIPFKKRISPRRSLKKNKKRSIIEYDETNIPFKKRISPRHSLTKNEKTSTVHRSSEPVPMEEVHSLHLPIITDDDLAERNKRLKTDDFWVNTQELVSPLRIQKIELHEREFDKPLTNRTVTFAKLPSMFNTPRDSEEYDTPRTNRDFRPCKLPIFSTPRYYSTPEEYNPFVVAEKQLMELLQCDDFKPYNMSSPSKNLSSKCTPIKSTAQNKHSQSNINSKTPSAKRSSIIDPPDDFQDKMLLLQDNFELIENFINDNYVPNDNTINSEKASTKSKVSNHSDSNKNKTSNGLSLNCILSERKYSDDMNSIDPSLINETDNLSIPDKLPLDNCSPMSSNHELDHYSVQYDKKISALEPMPPPINDKIKRSLSSQDDQTLDDIDFDEFISSFDDDESFPTLKSFLQSSKSDKSEKKIIQKSTVSLNSSFGKNVPSKGPEIKKPITPLKRSVSLSNPVVKARSMKNKQDIQEYLHAKDTKPTKKTEREKNTKISPKLNEELFPPDHEMYEDYKKYKDLYKQEKNEFIAEQKKAIGDGDYDEISSNEDPHLARKLHAGKVCGDSAYGSLNRKSPKIQPRASSNRHGQVAQKPLRSSVERSPSSSGSETSVTAPAKIKSRIPKFCHECGTKYPVDVAKFCVECGVKRLVL